MGCKSNPTTISLRIFSRPGASRTEGWLRSFARAVTPVVLLATLLLAITGLYEIRRIDSIISWLQGERIVVDHAFKTVLVHRPSGQAVVDYRLTNISDHPVMLAGAATSCSCTTVEGLPTVLESKQSRTLSARISADEMDDELIGAIQIFTDEPGTPVLKLSYKVQAGPPR